MLQFNLLSLADIDTVEIMHWKSTVLLSAMMLVIKYMSNSTFLFQLFHSIFNHYLKLAAIERVTEWKSELK